MFKQIINFECQIAEEKNERLCLLAFHAWEPSQYDLVFLGG
jgi:hypothetical protein